ncbi:MAG: insulinase family protein, partial [Clostridia bacterium]|nr:insulinase family protein [Clostridia bacterium]
MELHPSDSLHGFTVRRIRQVPGKNAELVEMVFEKTGTELNWFKSKEPNKLFCIAFKTLPDDHTGVFHILEHSVLCGSEQYPVKEPFVELLKSSMNTFLNAMTYPDKTIYPVSSRNEQDYLNLAGVYLDAVFAPKILTNPNIFYQEGWHYETDGDALRLNGVVFNEMKGALSSMDDLIMENMQQMLFSDTAYGYNSGGDPQAIPTLTYEQFVATYRRNYHASNARVYLDGDIPLEKTLILLEQYLSRFEKQEVTGFEDQTPKATEKIVYYEADPGEDLADKAQLMLGRIIGKWSEKTRLFAAHVLCDLLTDSNDAPLKRAILQAGLGQDVTAEVLDGIYQPFVALRIHNMNHARAGEVRALIEETLQKLVREGIDRQLLTASINRLAFELKDAQEPQGLGRCVDALDSWLYGGDPMLYLDCDEAIPALHAMCETGEFESLLEELFLKPEGLCVLHALPSLTYGEEMRAQEAAFLKAARDRMTAEQIEEIKQREAALRRWQQTPDDPKALATLPVLDLAMISREPSMTEPAAFTAAGVPVLRHSIETNGIVHFNLYFALTPYSLEELTRLSFAAV